MAEIMRVYPCDLDPFGQCPYPEWRKDCAHCGADIVFDDEEEDDPPPADQTKIRHELCAD